MKYVRMPIEIESPEMVGYDNLKNNLTESSVFDAHIKDMEIDLRNLILCYGHHIGKLELREIVASEYQGFSADDILLTAGAATALFIINTSLLQPNDEIIVMHPNYGTNIETPRAIGCKVKLWHLKIENSFKPNLEDLKSLITKKTKVISITTPHNPTGMQISNEELVELSEIAKLNNCILLVDETYRDIPFGSKTQIAASISENVISVSSVSKAYGLPGIRIGWIACKNKFLMNLFLAAKEQIQICNSVVDEEIAFQFLLKKKEYISTIEKHLNDNFAILYSWLSGQKYFEYVLPKGGCVCFPKLSSQINIEMFYQLLNSKYGTFVGNGHWFEMDKHFMRIGFGWCKRNELIDGLRSIDLVLREIA